MSSHDQASETRQTIHARIAAERAEWDALVAEVDPAAAIEPSTIGDWTFKDVVAHLAGWRQRFVDEIVAALQGTTVPNRGWPHTYEESADESPDGEAKTQAINDWMYEQSRHRTYNQVLAEYALQWTTIQAALDLMPDDLLTDPTALATLGGQSLADTLTGPDAFSHFHDEHEAEIRAWLAARRTAEAPGTPPVATCAECGGTIEQEDLVCPHCGMSLVGG